MSEFIEQLAVLADALPLSAREGEWYVHEEQGNCSIRIRTSPSSYRETRWFLGDCDIAQFICACRNLAVMVPADE